MKKTKINLVPNIQNPSPDYYCTWQTQLYATNDGKPEGQRAMMGETAIFAKEKPFGWAYFYEKARNDLIFVMDDSWDVPIDNDLAYSGSLILNNEKFPNAVNTSVDNVGAMKKLANSIKSIGWKGIGGWVCAQESSKFIGDKNQEDYWIQRLIEAEQSGFSYWKVDWGKSDKSFIFRNMLTELGRKYAPNLVIEHAMIPEIIPYTDVFRTYDVPAIASIPMTLEKISLLSTVSNLQKDGLSLINCEDEAYISAACGLTMGIMRHPYSGRFLNGKCDMSFPDIHRNIKTKMFEVVRAVRWHRIAPAFAFDGKQLEFSKELLYDTWEFQKPEEEIEDWWLGHPLIMNSYLNGILMKSAHAVIARNTSLPEVVPDDDGQKPFIVASKNPNGAYSIATLGRTIGRRYYIPKCDVTVEVGDSEIIGVFGEYNKLTIKTKNNDIRRVLLQDLASDFSYDISNFVEIKHGKIVIDGELISKIGTEAQSNDDTSEPGVVLFIEKG